MFFFKKNKITPAQGEIEEAKSFPNGWVYRIAPNIDSNGDVPPEAIVGAWQVDANGLITGEFKNNPNYDSKKWPMK